MTEAVTWLINEQPKYAYNIRNTDKGIYIVLANPPRKAEILITDENNTHVAIWADMEQYEPIRQTKPQSKEDFMKVLQSTVRWVGGGK
jgi:hypothetical protein